jgi:hypothetical protein
MMDVYSSLKIQARVIPEAYLTRQHPTTEAEMNYLFSRINIVILSVPYIIITPNHSPTSEQTP